jgi:hypothetical protein
MFFINDQPTNHYYCVAHLYHLAYPSHNDPNTIPLPLPFPNHFLVVITSLHFMSHYIHSMCYDWCCTFIILLNRVSLLFNGNQHLPNHYCPIRISSFLHRHCLLAPIHITTIHLVYLFINVMTSQLFSHIKSVVIVTTVIGITNDKDHKVHLLYLANEL